MSNRLCGSLFVGLEVREPGTQGRLMLSLLLATALLNDPKPEVWYGPASVAFAVQFPGNPYDPTQNDVRVRFVPARGPAVERLAYFDDGVWRAHLVAPEPGEYRPILVRNGEERPTASDPATVTLKDRLPKGFIRRDTRNANRFRWDDGSPYVPLGANMGWQTANFTSMVDQLAEFAKRGMNWTRIWACHWDGKNPWWPYPVERASEAVPGQLWTGALQRWDKLVAAADTNGVAVQIVLFHHGQFSSTVNPNWDQHPWNAANGGFLKTPEAFFSDPEAKRRTQMWLRQAVARWAHIPNVMAWELFNEVEWVDALRQNKAPEAVATWHDEMAAYLRSLDPYGRMVTTSSAMEHAGIYRSADFYQPHTYPPDIFAAILGEKLPGDKPLFFGEFGPLGGAGDDDPPRAIREGLYAGILANHAGPGAYWYWDRLEVPGAYEEFTRAARVLTLSGWAERFRARPQAMTAQTDGKADLVVRPGMGWGNLGRANFKLPDDATPANLGRLPGFFQSSVNEKKSMWPGPLTFEFEAATPGKVTFEVRSISARGAEVRATLNDRARFEKRFPGSGQDRNVTEKIEIPYAAGKHRLVIENVGPDWFTWGSLTFPGIGPQARVTALADADWAMARVTAAPGSPTPLEVTLGNLGLTAGPYRLTTVDLATGTETNRDLQVGGAGHRERVSVPADAILVFRRP